LKVLKNKSVFSEDAPMVFIFLCIQIVNRNTFKVFACFYENTNSGDFTGSRIRNSPTLAAPQFSSVDFTESRIRNSLTLAAPQISL
jgi:hypothetical protein